MSTRLERLRKKLSEKADSMLITSKVSCRYLTEFDYDDGFVLVTPKRAFLITDSRYTEAARGEANPQFEVVEVKSSFTKTIKDLLLSDASEVIAIEEYDLSCEKFDAYKREFEDFKLSYSDRIIPALRQTKDEKEVENIKFAQSITESAFNHILGNINGQITEREVALELEHYMRKNGADGIAFDTIAVSGKQSSLPHGVPRDKKLEKGFLTLDFGARYKGYCSDMTRTVVIGKADEEMKHLYNTVLCAQMKALEVIGRDEKCKSVDAVARDIIDASKYCGCFRHSLGHGVGLEIHENPRLSPSAKEEKLVQGNVVTVEPGIYIEGRYGVRIEDMVYISENGAVNLTNAPKNLIEVC